MKNDFIDQFKNTVILRIKGKNIERFIKRMISLQIELLEMNYLKYNEVMIKIEKRHVSKIEEIKTIYEIDVIDIGGIDKIKILFKRHKYILVFILISFLFILYLSYTIFTIEVVHSNPEIRELLLEELRENDIRVYGMKKRYSEIVKIKQKILEKHKDKIEWLEIENSGTKYIVKVEERKLTQTEDGKIPRHIIAKKDALILSVQATEGEIVKNKNDYVRKGDVVISGNIALYDEVKNQLSATGVVYGEVWYKITVEYPLIYQEEQITSEKISAYSLLLGNKKITTNKKGVITHKKTILDHLFLPISLIKEEKNKVTIVDQKLTKKEAIEKAQALATSKLKSKLNDKEYIITSKKLQVEENDSKIVLEIFFTVCEDITEYQIIEKIEGE